MENRFKFMSDDQLLQQAKDDYYQMEGWKNDGDEISAEELDGVAELYGKYIMEHEISNRGNDTNRLAIALWVWVIYLIMKNCSEL